MPFIGTASSRARSLPRHRRGRQKLTLVTKKNGLKLVQLRFYECATVVPAAEDPNGLQVDTACFE
jgi:hypothetical protein